MTDFKNIDISDWPLSTQKEFLELRTRRNLVLEHLREIETIKSQYKKDGNDIAYEEAQKEYLVVAKERNSLYGKLRYRVRKSGKVFKGSGNGGMGVIERKILIEDLKREQVSVRIEINKTQLNIKQSSSKLTQIKLKNDLEDLLRKRNISVSRLAYHSKKLE